MRPPEMMHPWLTERVGRDADARVRLVAEDELRRRVVGHAGADRPARVVEVEERMDGDEVHLRFPVRVDRPDVAPVAAGVLVLAGDGVRGEVVGVDGVPVGDHPRKDVVTEVVRAPRRPASRRAALMQRRRCGRRSCPSTRGTCPGCPASSAGPSPSRGRRRCARRRRPRSRRSRSPPSSGRGWRRSSPRRPFADVEVDHLPHVHLVDVVAAEDREHAPGFSSVMTCWHW